MQPAASWKAVLEVTKTAWTQNDPPLVFGMDVVTCIHERGIGLPSIELAQVLVHCLATGGPSVATMWAYIQHAMSCHMVSALHMLALLTSRILPSRQQQPEMYKMYLDLTSTYAFSLSSTKSIPCRDRVVKAVDEALQLSKNPEAPIAEVGVVIVHFLFALVARLAEAVYEDWISNKGMAYDEGLEQLKKNNSLAAVHLMAKIMENKRTAGLLRIARRNLPDQWTLFVQRLQLLESLTNDASSMAPKEAMEALGQLAKAIQQGLRQEWRPTQMPVIRSLLPSQSRSWSFGNAGGLGCSSLWLPFDVYMEAAMEGRRLSTTSNADVLADVMKAMQSVHMANWVDLFLGLWTAALRLVRRNRDSIEGPSPHVDSRLCMLLAITPIAIGIVIDDEERGQLHPENASGELQPSAPATNVVGVRRAALETCLQVLGQFEALLVPPPIVAAAANQVAAKAAAFASTGGQSMSADISNSGKSAVGTMRHLIVESCIARGLLANTAYYWLGTGGAMANIPASPPQPSPWAAFMDGAPLSAPLRAALMTSPAGSLAELEKIYKTAMVGPEEERPAAASILCGASLLRSWTVQEHAVHFAVQLLSPPVSDNWGGSNNGLLAHAPMLCAALQGMNNADVMNVLSLFGMFPEIAAALLPICEMFGSVPNAKPIATSMGEEISAHMLFTLAFLKLVKLWKFHRPPLEHCLLGSGAGLGADLSLEYLLQLRNIQLASPSRQRMQLPGSSYPTSPTGVVTLDSFPRLRVWYMQHQACISSTISSVLRSNPMHQVGDRLLAMMFKKVNKTGSASTPGLSGNASGPSEDAAGRPILCAWDVIQAVPNVLEYALTACSHSTLSPRELTTGLRELVDYLPATIATIVSYCLAEVTRGLWKYASMNGQDWPSPAANLLAIQGEVKDILAASGVDFTSNPPGAGGGNAPVSLPLPLAALIGLTITFKLDKTGETVLSIAGPGLETCSSAGPWFSIQVVAALWAQKVKRWHDYIVFMGACHIFKQNKTALLQLLKNMFAVTLSTATAPGSKLQVNGGVGALLGHGPWSAYAPGILYLRSYSTLHDIMFLSCETLDLVAQAARELGSQGDVSAADHGSRLRCVQASLSTCMARAVQASSLGASLLYVSGGTTLVTKLFTESIPTWFLSGSGSKGAQSPGGMVLEGYAIAHFALLSGALAWGVSAQTCQSESSGVPGLMQRHRVLGSHMEFVASGLGGELTMSCEQTLWRSYVVGFLALMVTCTPTWILELKVETLRKLATGLRFWHEHDLAVALLERGGPSAMGAAAELTLC